jgi:hypothetical protein
MKLCFTARSSAVLPSGRKQEENNQFQPRGDVESIRFDPARSLSQQPYEAPLAAVARYLSHTGAVARLISE